MIGWFLFVCLFLQLCSNTEAKTVSGVFTSNDAKWGLGQYVASFCFHGEAMIEYEVNATDGLNPTLYMFLHEDWEEVRDSADCHAKLQANRLTHELYTLNGSIALPTFMLPRIWHIIYADPFTCNDSLIPNMEYKLNYMAFTIKLYNPDSLGNPTEHFSEEETGLLRFYQLLTLGYFLLGCIYAPRLSEALAKTGPMHLVLQLLTGATALQGAAALLTMMHLRGYSKDGMGSPFSELLSEFFDVLSQFFMLYMMISLSLGWTLAATHKQTSLLSRIQNKPAVRVVVVIGLFQGLLFIWEQLAERQHRMFHAHRSWAGVSLVFTRVIMAALFALNLHTTVAKERSALKRDFYNSFTKCCLLWFLSYPVMEALSWTFTSYFRYKFVTMCVVFCQCAAVILLYRLFLSRSLYWEVSALSSTLLPLRMDSRSLKYKAYS